MTPGFEHWWALVWRKEGKTPARYEYDIALELTDHETLCEGARRRTAAYLRDGTPTDKQIMPKNWLRDQRWTDELPAVVSGVDGERQRLRMKMDLALRGILRVKQDPRDVARALELCAITQEQAKQLGL